MHRLITYYAYNDCTYIVNDRGNPNTCTITGDNGHIVPPMNRDDGHITRCIRHGEGRILYRHTTHQWTETGTLRSRLPLMERYEGVYGMNIWDRGEVTLYMNRDKRRRKGLYHAETRGTLYHACINRDEHGLTRTETVDPLPWFPITLWPDSLFKFRNRTGDKTGSGQNRNLARAALFGCAGPTCVMCQLCFLFG